MAKITFMGAGSTVFVRNVLGDCMCREPLKDSHFALYDIDAQRLKESKLLLDTLNANINDNRATITTHHGVENRKEALRNSDFVVNAIQVGGYEPSTVIDFEIPKKFGLRQTIADTLGIGGIFRALRTIPVMLDFAADIEKVAPNAWFLNYTNPMAMLTGAMLQGTSVKTVGLCHSVQCCVRSLLETLGEENPEEREKNIHAHIAGINH
ncbi:MAG: alpha-glucosidase/alpha-galactosidase, partial [Victivallales bacterium]|nr:alpha-glucosidase/alpha-galactosidase [Victivallales bacterium]